MFWGHATVPLPCEVSSQPADAAESQQSELDVHTHDGMSRVGSFESLCAAHSPPSPNGHLPCSARMPRTPRGSFACCLNDAEPSSSIPRNKSIEFTQGMTDEGFSFSCTLRASQENLLGMGLSCIPHVKSQQDLASAPRKVTRTFTVTVNPPAYKPPRKLVMLCSWLLWLVSTASAAALVAFGVWSSGFG